jgi:hypothetical protein
MTARTSNGKDINGKDINGKDKQRQGQATA